MQVSKISFNGIYDIKFSKSTSNEKIDQTKEQLCLYLSEPNLSDHFDVIDFKNMANNKNDNKGIRLISPIDNPSLMVDMLSKVNEKLALQYIEKSKIDLYA